MAALQSAIDLIAAAEIRDGLLVHEGRNLTSDDLIFAVESHLLENGNSTVDSICCGGPESADPHRTSSDVIRAGLPIVLDIYPFDKRTRYWGDMTRTVVRGHAASGGDAHVGRGARGAAGGARHGAAGRQRARRPLRVL